MDGGQGTCVVRGGGGVYIPTEPKAAAFFGGFAHPAPDRVRCRRAGESISQQSSHLQPRSCRILEAKQPGLVRAGMGKLQGKLKCSRKRCGLIQLLAFFPLSE